MEQRRFPRWPVAVLVSLGLVGAFVAVAGAIEASNDRLMISKAAEVCAPNGVKSVSTVGGGQIVCVKSSE